MDPYMNISLETSSSWFDGMDLEAITEIYLDGDTGHLTEEPLMDDRHKDDSRCLDEHSGGRTQGFVESPGHYSEDIDWRSPRTGEEKSRNLPAEETQDAVGLSRLQETYSVYPSDADPLGRAGQSAAYEEEGASGYDAQRYESSHHTDPGRSWDEPTTSSSGSRRTTDRSDTMPRNVLENILDSLGTMTLGDPPHEPVISGTPVGSSTPTPHSETVHIPVSDILPRVPASRKRLRGYRNWEFLMRLLVDPRTNPALIEWEDEVQGTFRLKRPALIAQMWASRRTSSSDVSYNNFARGLRYNYRKGILISFPERHLVYRCGPKALEFLEELRRTFS